MRLGAATADPLWGSFKMIFLNGAESELRAGDDVGAVLARLGLALDAKGIAVAVDGAVVPRGDWQDFALPEGARVEVLTAMQGG
jgi:sulfur carrier protein